MGDLETNRLDLLLHYREHGRVLYGLFLRPVAEVDDHLLAIAPGRWFRSSPLRNGNTTSAFFGSFAINSRACSGNSMNPLPSTFDPWNDCASFATNRYGVPDTPGRLQPPPTRAPSSRPLGHRRHRRGREAHPRRTGTGGLPMTRPAVQMCARCERSASEPFPIREFRAPADPGLCIYACQECVTHCPTLQDSVELRESPSPPLAHDTPRPQGRREGHHDRRPRQGRDRDRRAHRTCPVHVHISAMRMPWLQGDAIANTRQLRPPRTQHDQASEAFAGGARSGHGPLQYTLLRPK